MSDQSKQFSKSILYFWWYQLTKSIIKTQLFHLLSISLLSNDAKYCTKRCVYVILLTHALAQHRTNAWSCLVRKIERNFESEVFTEKHESPRSLKSISYGIKTDASRVHQSKRKLIIRLSSPELQKSINFSVEHKHIASKYTK